MNLSTKSGQPGKLEKALKQSTNYHPPTSASGKLSYTIQVSFWENQRYEPLLRKWCPPWQTEKVPHFSDLEGKHSLDFNPQTKKASLELPPGWDWLTNEWEIDKSQVKTFP